MTHCAVKAGRLPTFLASEANGDAEKHHGGPLHVHVARMGRHYR